MQSKNPNTNQKRLNKPKFFKKKNNPYLMCLRPKKYQIQNPDGKIQILWNKNQFISREWTNFPWKSANKTESKSKIGYICRFSFHFWGEKYDKRKTFMIKFEEKKIYRTIFCECVRDIECVLCIHLYESSDGCCKL